MKHFLPVTMLGLLAATVANASTSSDSIFSKPYAGFETTYRTTRFSTGENLLSNYAPQLSFNVGTRILDTFGLEFGIFKSANSSKQTKAMNNTSYFQYNLDIPETQFHLLKTSTGLKGIFLNFATYFPVTKNFETNFSVGVSYMKTKVDLLEKENELGGTDMKAVLLKGAHFYPQATLGASYALIPGIKIKSGLTYENTRGYKVRGKAGFSSENLTEDIFASMKNNLSFTVGVQLSLV